MRLIDADEFVKEMNERIEAAIKWGTNAIADRNEEIKTRAEQAVATFCEASLTANKMPTIDAVPVKRGKWKTFFHGTINSETIFSHSCSMCGHGAVSNVKTPFCAYCGAKMDEENGDDKS